MDLQGNAVAVWFERGEGVVKAATRPAGGSWSTPQNLSVPNGNIIQVEVALDAQGNATAVWNRLNISSSEYRVQARSRPAGGDWSLPQDVSTAGSNAIRFFQLAVGAEGTAVAAWETPGGVIQGAVRPAGGPWSTPEDLTGEKDNVDPQVAVGRNGHAVVLWVDRTDFDDRVVQARTRPPGGPWSPTLNVTPPGEGITGPYDRGFFIPLDGSMVAIDSDGNAVAIWERTDGVDDGRNKPVYSATLAEGNDRWSTPVSLAGTANAYGLPKVAVDAQDNTVAVWANRIVQTATRPRGGSWSTPENLTIDGQAPREPQLAVNPQGDAVAAWSRQDGFISVVQAAARPAGASTTWSASRDVSAAGLTHNANIPDVGIDAAGNAVALWIREFLIGGGNEIRVIQAAGFDAAGPQLLSLRVPADGTTGSPVAFSVAPLDVWSAVASTRWDFGDGSGADGSSVSHGYSAPGSYVVTVTSTDSLNNVSSEKRTVVIAAAPVAAPPPATPSTPPAGETAASPAPASEPAPAGAGSTGAIATTAVTTPGSAVPGPAPTAGFGGAPNARERSALSRCLAGARRLKTARARRKARAACARPGRVGGLKARARSSRTVRLSFLAPGAVSRFAPAARRYVVKQSFKPIRSERSFRAAPTLCRRSCSFAPARVGQRLELTVTDLKPRTTYYYAIKAVGAAQRTGPRSTTAKATTR